MQEFSKGQGAYDHKPKGKSNLQEVYNELVEGIYKDQITKIRTTEGDTRKKLKESLNTWVFSGVFEYINDNNLLQASNYINVDFDHIAKVYDLEEVKERLSKLNGFRLAFVSPSGDGLKAVFESKTNITDKENYKRVWEALHRYLIIEIGIDFENSEKGYGLDKGVKNISRFCYVSYDEKAILKNEEETGYFDSSLFPEPERIVKPISFNGYNTLDDGIEELVRRVEEARIDITAQHENYFKLSCSFASLGERGRELFHRICAFYPNYQCNQTDKYFNYALRQYGQNSNIGTFVNLCKEHNIETRGLSNNSQQKITDYRQSNINNRPLQENANNEEIEPKKGTLEYFNTKENYLLPFSMEVLQSLQIDDNYIETDIKLYRYGDEEGKEAFKLKLPKDSYTNICGMEGHGKSRVLQHIALDILNKCEEGEGVFYYTNDEGLRRVLSWLANIYIDHNIEGLQQQENILFNAVVSGEPETVLKMLKDGEDKERVLKRVKEFKDLLTSKLIVRSDELTITDLLERLSKNDKIKLKAVFIDYIQLFDEAKGTKSTNDYRLVMKRVAQEIKKWCEVNNIPVILGTQLNNEPKGPYLMSKKNIAEAHDISRLSSEELFIWNSNAPEEETEVNNHGDHLKRIGFEVGKPGKIFITLKKSRYYETNLEGVLKFTGKVGIIENLERNEVTRNEKDINAKCY